MWPPTLCLSQLQIVGWVGIARSKFYHWQTRYGKANEHNSWIPLDHWIDGWERDAIVNRGACAGCSSSPNQTRRS
jgi:hypothetical protein